MRMFKPHCTPVLPLVYDDSLSYYETLCKVIDRLNSIYANTTEEIERILDEMGISGDVRYKNVLNVRDFGAVGDGRTDDRLAIQDALNEAYDAGGGVVFVPAGHYKISKCIIVGTNCILAGCGAASIIDLVDTNPYWGVAVGIMGSNCGLSGLKILYYDYVDAPIVSGPAWGAVGATNSEYYSAVDQQSSAIKVDYENIVIQNVYTEGFYSLQIEPTTKIKNVTYKDCHCAGSMMSLQAGTTQGTSGPGKIENVTVENCICDYFRILGGNDIVGVNVSNLHTHYIYTLGSGIHFNNFIVDARTVSPFDTLQAPIGDGVAKFFNLEGAARCSAANGLILGRKTNIPVNGLLINQYSVYDFIAVYVNGFATRNIGGSAANTGCTWIACHAAEDGVSNAPTGKGVASDMGAIITNVLNNHYYTDVYRNIPVAVTPAEGYGFSGRTAAENAVYKNGQIVVGQCTIRKETGLVLDEVIGTIADPPANDSYMHGTVVYVEEDNSELVAPATVKIAAGTGAISIVWMARHTPSSYTTVMFSVMYAVAV